MWTEIGKSDLRERRSTEPLRICAAVVGAYALLIGLLVIIIFFEDGVLNVPLIVLFAIGVVVAVVARWARRGWAAWVAVAYSVGTLAADGPHQIPELLRPTSAVHTAGAAILVLAGAVSIIVSLWAAVTPRRSRSS